ncbi:hypothetical protein [Rhizohabitans arisaemae]|uniref:hypothetical protein n=1 Tax=Rhizohabitans arisaemae TaxID=2720610 RepID=UPI0024B28029|nr:hypothetical protein [Rhizohabitans arisaemae]
MKRLMKELRDPWGLLLGATAGGVAWAASVHPAAAALVGVSCWVAKAGVGAYQTRGESRTELGVDPRSGEAEWLRRGGAAARQFAELAASLPPGPVSERIEALAPHVDDAVTTLRRLAGQASLVDRAAARIDAGFLRQERRRLTHAQQQATPELAAERARSLAGVEAQLAVHDRLTGTWSLLLARLESGAIGLESLLARVVELSALSATGSPERLRALDELSEELDGIRQALHETEDITRTVLDG